jgi:Mg2+ and Co2+ transporter CorA
VAAMVVDTFGVRSTASAAELRDQMSRGAFFWLDIFGGDDPLRTEFLRALGLEGPDITWALRFGQAGRMYIGRDKLRAVTWIAGSTGNVSEVHVFCNRQCVITAWHGDAATLDDIRQQFGERAGGLGHSHYAAAGILLQLLIGTLDHAVQNLDAALDDLRARLDKSGPVDDFAAVARRLHKLQSIMATFNRYSSAVRSAVVGIEAVPGMDDDGAAELNEYSEQVEDIEQQIHERRRWMSDIMHDNATAIAQRQGEQINRLTLVSLIFLPVTALSGFFGMNFNWMINHIDSGEAFLALGVVLPLLSVVLSIVWFRHRGLIQLNLRQRPTVRDSVLSSNFVWSALETTEPEKAAALPESSTELHKTREVSV